MRDEVLGALSATIVDSEKATSSELVPRSYLPQIERCPMATITILKAIITQIKDVRKVMNADEGSVGDSHYDLSRAIWNIESVMRREQRRRK
jgi:hypothetical protein